LAAGFGAGVGAAGGGEYVRAGAGVAAAVIGAGLPPFDFPRRRSNMMTTAALEEGVITPKDSRLVCGHGIQMGNKFVACMGNHGSPDIHAAIVHSCDGYFYRLGLKMGLDGIEAMVDEFGGRLRQQLLKFQQSNGPRVREQSDSNETQRLSVESLTPIIQVPTEWSVLASLFARSKKHD